MTTILVVDDEYLLAEVITLALEEAGFMVTQASNGKKALEALEREGPTLVISDLMMPLMNGLELALMMRERAEWASIPIILMSGGHVDLAQKNKHIFNRIIQKPFGLSEITDLVIELVGPPEK